ncbi:MAG: TIGR04282 family arsenosugar biosynthesis glycosyltransferase [Bacteroidetes bacterium]|nr:TIGR04282 family arsenosugar biosynthesis glycosyltransferase [Bacteroidota bacterium]
MIVVFARAPILGNVKTRLAATLGNERALAVYRRLAEETMKVVGQSGLDAMIACDIDEECERVEAWLGATTFPQRGPDLGARIVNAMMTGFDEDDRVIIIGTDTPHLRADLLRQADAALDTADVVMGPATDGGFYLIGFSGPHIDVVHGVQWSTDTVAERIRKNCAAMKAELVELEPLSDVDVEADLHAATEHAAFRDSPLARSLRDILLAAILVLAPASLLAQGGWIQKPGEGFVQVSGQTLSTTSAYDLYGAKSVTPRYSLYALNIASEVGLVPQLMATVSGSLYRSSAFEGSTRVGGIGDITVGLRYGLVAGDWPITVGLAADLPTGDSSLTDGVNPLPTGDGEFNTWLNVGVSHSFWPTNAYVMADAGFNVRTGGFTNQYRLFTKGGYKIADPFWTSISVYRLGTVGTPDPTMFSANGLGEGVEYWGWDLGVQVDVEIITITADVSGAFASPRAIYGGMNILIGVLKKF